MNAKSQASIGVCSRRVSWKTRLSGLAFSASNKLDLQAERLRHMPTHSNSSASTALQLALYTVETKRSSLICLESDGCLMRDCQSSTSGAFFPIFVFTEVTKCDGKAACFQKLMIATPQASIGVCKRRGSWQTQLSSLMFSASNKVDRCRSTPPGVLQLPC